MGERNGAPPHGRPARRGVMLAGIVAGLLALGVGAVGASAAQVPTSLVFYAASPAPAEKVILAGAVFSARTRCVKDRKVKMVVRNAGGKTAWDVTRTSPEGSFALVGALSELLAADRAQIVATRKRFRKGSDCAPERLEVRVAVARAAARSATPLAARGKVTGSTVRGLGIDGIDEDGAAYGIVTSPKPRCLRGRTVKLFSVLENGERVLLDYGRTSRGGAWAGHVTAAQDTVAEHYLAVLKRKKYRRGGKKRVCAGDRHAFGQISILRGGHAPGW